MAPDAGDGVVQLMYDGGRKELSPKPLMLFRTWDEVALWVDMYGAQSHPFVQLSGGCASKRVWVCAHPLLSANLPRRKRQSVAKQIEKKRIAGDSAASARKKATRKRKQVLPLLAMVLSLAVVFLTYVDVLVVLAVLMSCAFFVLC